MVCFVFKFKFVFVDVLRANGLSFSYRHLVQVLICRSLSLESVSIVFEVRARTAQLVVDNRGRQT